MLEKALFVTKLFLDGWEKLLLENVFVSFSKLLSLKVDSAVGSEHLQCRACSGMAAGRCECIWMHSEAKTFGGWPDVKKRATSLQEKHQEQTDILQKLQRLHC